MEEEIGLTIDEILESVYQKLRQSCGAVDIECGNDGILGRQMRGNEFSNCERLFEIKKDGRPYWVGLSKTEKEKTQSLIGETSNIFVLNAKAYDLLSYQEIKTDLKKRQELLNKYNFDALMRGCLLLVAWKDGCLGKDYYLKIGNFQEIMEKFSKQTPILNQDFVFSPVEGHYGKLYEKKDFLWSPLFADYLTEVIKKRDYYKCFN